MRNTITAVPIAIMDADITCADKYNSKESVYWHKFWKKNHPSIFTLLVGTGWTNSGVNWLLSVWKFQVYLRGYFPYSFWTWLDINIVEKNILRHDFNFVFALRTVGNQNLYWKIFPIVVIFHGPIARCVKLRVVHAPGILVTFSPPPWLAILTCITPRASRTCRDACRDR